MTSIFDLELKIKIIVITITLISSHIIKLSLKNKFSFKYFNKLFFMKIFSIIVSLFINKQIKNFFENLFKSIKIKGNQIYNEENIKLISIIIEVLILVTIPKIIVSLLHNNEMIFDRNYYKLLFISIFGSILFILIILPIIEKIFNDKKKKIVIVKSVQFAAIKTIILITSDILNDKTFSLKL